MHLLLELNSEKVFKHTSAIKLLVNLYNWQLYMVLCNVASEVKFQF